MKTDKIGIGIRRFGGRSFLTVEETGEVIPYNPRVLERMQKILEAERRKALDDVPRTPEQRAVEAELERKLQQREAEIGIETEKYLLLTEVCRIFKMKPKAVKGFCTENNIPTKPEARKFHIALVPFATAYAQSTNRHATDAAKRRIAKAMQKHEITSKFDAATAQFFGVK